MKKLMILGAGPLQVEAYVEAKRIGCKTIAIDQDESAPGFDLADKFYKVSTIDVKQVLEIAKNEKIDGIMTLCTDLPNMTVAAVNQEFGLNGLSGRNVKSAIHKGFMRERLKEHKVASPSFCRTTNDEEIKKAVNSIGIPIIVKPAQSSGSRGVFLIDREEQIEEAIKHVRSVLRAEENEVIVEKYVEGPEVSVETLSFNGSHRIIAITDKFTTGSPHWVEMGHGQPSILPRHVQDRIVDTTKEGLDALGIMDTAAHVEIKVENDFPKIIEIGARLGGDFITTELTPRSTGVNMVRAAISLALGEIPEAEISDNKGAVIQYFDFSPGFLRKIKGIEEASKVMGVVSVVMNLREGDEIRPVRSSGDRSGHVIATGDTREAAQEAAYFAIGKIAADVG